MFVQTNSIRAVKDYFNSRLADLFSESEIRSIAKQSIMQRLNLSASDYLMADASLVSESDLLFFRSIVKRLQNEEPLQYLLGETSFCDLELKIDKRALIPRPETEELVNLVLSQYSNDHSYTIMDLCTGSGCIALALKSVLSQSEIHAMDFSADALDLAKENGIETDLQCVWHHFDATKKEGYLQFNPKSFDAWVSNPPYIPNAERVSMDFNVLGYEPSMALFVDDNDPLLFYRKIAEAALIYLKSGGMLFFEIHENFGKETVDLLEGLNFSSVKLHHDLQGKSRMVEATV
ncbi:MAG: peptide chain release factor N(5)-glutamine methyltransferase [Bacteroidota bacterium]